MEVQLTSPRSDRVKAIRRLGQRAVRERVGAFVVEGPQAVREALATHVARVHPGGSQQTGSTSSGKNSYLPLGVGQDIGLVREFYLTAHAAHRYPEYLAQARMVGVTPRGVSEDAMAALTDTVTPQGMLAVCSLLDQPADDVIDSACAASTVRLAVLAKIRDPGNAGTVLRVADATGTGGVLLSEGSVDVHNSKCVRSTAGSLFHLPVAQGVSLPEVAAVLRERGVGILAADGVGDQDLDDLIDAAVADPGALLNQPTAWIFGNEAWGLEAADRALADAVVRVPLHGRAESLNVAMAATICLHASAWAHTAVTRRTAVSRGRTIASR